MIIVQINATCGVGSTGKICLGISKLLLDEKIENYILYSNQGNNYSLGIATATTFELKRQSLKSRILGNWGFNSKRQTNRIIAQLEKIRPDIVHLHNLHGHNCNLQILFNYFKKKQIKLVWTFHDCWAFTGYCPHFSMHRCDKWKKSCNQCPQWREFSWFFDKSQVLFQKKKELFVGLDLTIVTPSHWLADLVKQSFLKEYPVKVIHNGIDLSIFKPTKSDFRERYGIENKYVVLGVAFDWGKRKGLDVFIELAKKLGENYQIVLVGTNEEIARQLPENILSIHKTQNQIELAELYATADVFINPTREENYPTVNMEALACGTPVITFRTGGSPEILDDTCGSVVECDDNDALFKEIIRVCEEKPYAMESCLMRAKQFNQDERYQEYLELYKA